MTGAWIVQQLRENGQWAELGRGHLEGDTIEVGEHHIDVRQLQSVLAVSDDLVIATRRAPARTISLVCEKDASQVADLLSRAKKAADPMGEYTADSVALYFSYYGKLSHQENMLIDHVRTSTYHRAVQENAADFHGKVVMDIGAGSGILSFFAAQSGAEKVWAVEASNMAEVVSLLAQAPANSAFGKAVEVVPSLLESISADSIAAASVDVLISEPIGTLLFNERMIETYLRARDRFLKPGGKMFPRGATLFVAPFSDALLWLERSEPKGLDFWKQTFYGVDLSPALLQGREDVAKQPIVDYVDPEHLVAQAVSTHFDFTTVGAATLEHIVVPFEVEISREADVHGLATWFDVDLGGSQTPVILSTAPTQPGTHWYQVRLLLRSVLHVKKGDILKGELDMRGNNRQSYDCRVSMRLGPDTVESFVLDLKEPEYRYFTSPNCYRPTFVHGASQQTSSATPAGGHVWVDRGQTSQGLWNFPGALPGGANHWDPALVGCADPCGAYWPIYAAQAQALQAQAWAAAQVLPAPAPWFGQWPSPLNREARGRRGGNSKQRAR
eukprot:TRINITY_DN108773_c0_g1_i1.p1 TRINITY_DN108773_c0_g1~~TRINITY_DN108773_c0_g1_i1.p1  ORF type:complete len:556 (+),score=90.97 TRINITY_DN108773_c0_g1_i1:42-1709(+)